MWRRDMHSGKSNNARVGRSEDPRPIMTPDRSHNRHSGPLHECGTHVLLLADIALPRLQASLAKVLE